MFRIGIKFFSVFNSRIHSLFTLYSQPKGINIMHYLHSTENTTKLAILTYKNLFIKMHIPLNLFYNGLSSIRVLITSRDRKGMKKQYIKVQRRKTVITSKENKLLAIVFWLRPFQSYEIVK